MRLFSILVGLLSMPLWTACVGAPPPSCADLRPFSGAPTAEVGIYTEGGAPWVEGGMVGLTLGGQGGFMVQPVLSLDGSVVGEGAPDAICARVEIDNVDPTGGDRFTGFETLTLALPFELNVVTGRYDSPVIANQLRWSPLPPGTGYRFDAVVRTETFAASVSRNVVFR